MKLNLDKAREILEMLQEDTITPKQAKELVTLLVQLTEKQKQDLIIKNEDFLSKVSQETFTQIQNALIEIKEKAHDNQLEVRQLTNKQKTAHEAKMAQLEALIEEFRAFEKTDEDKLTQDILSKIPESIKETPEETRDKLETLKEDGRLDKKAIKGLEIFIDKPILDRAIGILDQRTSFLINKINNLPQSSTGGGTWGSITGTLSDQTDLQTVLNTKQATLVSATNIKTINGSSILGSGDLVVSGGGSPGGALTSIQFNDSGSFGGFGTWDGTILDLGAGSLIVDTIKPTGGASTSINPNTRTLVDSLGTAVIDWSDPSAAATVKFASSYVSGTVTFDLSSTAGLDNVYTFPGQSGTFAMLSDIPTPPAFQTNGTPNGSQTLLNLIPGTNITLTDNGTGGVTIDATGIGQAQVLTLGLGA